MFQEIEPYTYCNDFAWVRPESTDRVLIYRSTKVLVATDAEGSLHFPSYGLLENQGLHASKQTRHTTQNSDIGAAGNSSATVEPIASKNTPAQRCIYKEDGTCVEDVFLFSVGQTAYFLNFNLATQTSLLDKALARAAISEHAASNNDLTWQFMAVSDLHHYAPQHRAFAGLVGYTYHTWYDTARFCGRCGTPLVHDEVERMMRCPQCDLMEFPRLFPAVIVGIVDKRHNRVLVSRYANREYKRYALIAGFSEMGETVEQTVHREVMEEVGLKVKNLRYYKSQPWPPSSSLLFGFFCELEGNNDITLDEHELEHAEWLPREELPREDANYSLTRDMMQVLREGRETRYPVSGVQEH